MITTLIDGLHRVREAGKTGGQVCETLIEAVEIARGWLIDTNVESVIERRIYGLWIPVASVVRTADRAE